MEDLKIINFGNFFKEETPKRKSNNFISLDEDFSNSKIFESDTNEEEEKEEFEKEIEENSESNLDSDNLEDEETKENEKEESEESEESEEVVNDGDFYIVFKDKSQDFSCDISLEGADLEKTSARLVFENPDWNLVFFGKIDKTGKCTIPIKKMSILNEGNKGKVKLEVIAEDNFFIPWEQDFLVKVSKKVHVKIHESTSNGVKPLMSKKSVKVNINKI